MSIVFSSLEMLATFTYYNIIFNKRVIKNFPIILVISIINGMIFSLDFNDGANSIPFILSVILCCFTISKLDKKDVMLSAIEFIISLIILSIGELLLLGISSIPFIHNRGLQDNEVFMLILLLFSATVVGLLLKKFRNKVSGIEDVISKNRVIWTLILNIVIFVVIIKMGVNADIFTNLEYFQVLIYLIALVLINIHSYKVIYSELEEKRELEINKEYTQVIDNLLFKFREKQHEYNNHLNTLNAMVLLEGNNEIKLKVANYIEDIGKQDKYSDLMYIDNTIIKAIFYSKIQECAVKNINFKYKVSSNLENSKLKNSNLSIVLNNLINNAIEAVSILDEKNIIIEIYEEDKYVINIKNNIDENNKIHISKIFQKGFSSKGEDRGFGLYNVKKIVESHKGEIQLFIKDGYLNFIIMF